ncbi:MAG: M23 family metallopeptidase [bacterium]
MARNNRRTSRPKRRKKLIMPPVRQGAGGGRRRIAHFVLAGVLVLVSANLYAFVWGRRSLRNVYKAAQVEAAKPKEKKTTARKSVAARRQERNRFLRLPRSITEQDMVEQEEDALLEIEAFSIHGRIRRGDNLYSALKRVGVNRLLGDTVVRTFDHLYNFRRARPGQKFSVRLSQDRQRLLGFEFQASPGEIYRIGRRGKTLVAKKVNRPVVTRIFELASPIRGSLWNTFKQLGEDGRLLASFVAVFSWDLNLYTDVHPGDTIRIIVEKQFQGESLLGYGRILAAEFVGKRRRVRAFWYRPPKGSGGYFDEAGTSLHRTLLRSPLRYRRISSQFDRRRMHPVLHTIRAHNGVDYAAPHGTPVWAVADGEVIFIGRNRAAGKMIVLSHEQSMRTLYMHLSDFRRGLIKGSKVRQRQVIGYVGATGIATGPHLHFGLKIGDAYVDPEKHRRVRRPPVPPKYRADFVRCITPLSGTLNGLRPTAGAVHRPAGRTVINIADEYRSR